MKSQSMTLVSGHFKVENGVIVFYNSERGWKMEVDVSKRYSLSVEIEDGLGKPTTDNA